MKLESIRELAKKLAALAAPDSGATANERQVAFAKLERLLAKHHLSMDALTSDATHTMWVRVRNDDERNLFHQCAFHVLQVRAIQTVKGRWGRVKEAGVDGVTAIQEADIRACFVHYLKELRQRVGELEREIQLLRDSIGKAGEAVIHAHRIYGPAADDNDSQAPPLDPAELEAILRAMQGMVGHRWSKPAAMVGQETLHLESKA